MRIWQPSQFSKTKIEIEIKSQNRIFGLDLMRACAILMVVLGHCTWIFPQDDSEGMRLLAFSGYFGVEMFFVLSGFLIGNILYKMFLEVDFSFESIMIFLKRRWFRTLPNYYLILLVNLLIAFWIGYEVQDGWRYFVFLQNFASPMLPFFPESWSLSVEEFAYLILPFTMLVFATTTILSKPGRFLIAVSTLIVICLISKWAFHYFTPAPTLEIWNLALRMVLVFRLDAIFTGVLFSWIFQNYNALWIRTKYLSAATGLFMFGFFLLGIGRFQLTIDHYPLFWNVFYLPLTSLTIALFLPLLSSWTKERKVISQPVTFISLISYSIYLLHYGVVLQLLKHFFKIDTSEGLEVIAFVALYLALTFILSYVLYRFYEKPMTDLREKR